MTAMRFRTWPVAALGLGGLLLLVVVSVFTATNRAQEIYTQLDQLNTHHRNVETKLRRLRSDLHVSGIYVRDYLLDPAREQAPAYRQQLAEFRGNMLATVVELQALSSGQPENLERITRLQVKLDEYWQVFEPLFDWSLGEKVIQSTNFLRREVLPRREAVLTIASEIEELNNANHALQRAEVTRRQEQFSRELHRLLWGSLFLGLVVALTAVIRLSFLERRSEHEREVAEHAEQLMRQLSQQLVAAQEEERKNLSRELHDHVGQMLTALRMELGRIDRLRSASDSRVAGAVKESRQLVDDMVRTVRDLALGLRPSMLDDFGLQPALEWHVRDFSRRSGLTVDLRVDGEFERLSDPHRTCVYRVVQEALTNCVRHASASRIEVSVAATDEGLDVKVADNGVGFDVQRRATGLGLRGIEERVRELSGSMTIGGIAGRGTTLRVHLPASDRMVEVPLARAAG
jgi:signal transduction histidine kinase